MRCLFLGVILDNPSGKSINTIIGWFKILKAFFIFLHQVVPGRMGLLVTLFLSLTALLVSTISSSPEVFSFSFFPFSKMHEQCSLNIFFEGFRRDNSSRLLGACPFLLHLWSNCCLHVPTGLDQNEQEWRRRDEGRWRWRKSLEDWQEHASALRFHVCPVQCYILACVSDTSIMKRNHSNSLVLIYDRKLYPGAVSL